MNMWVRGEVFDHGVVPWTALGDTGSFSPVNVEKKKNSDDGGTEDKDLDVHGLGSGFEMIGQLVWDLHERSMGTLLQNGQVEELTRLVVECCNDVAGIGGAGKALSQAECRALVELFFAFDMLREDVASMRQLEGEFALFLAIQIAKQWGVSFQTKKGKEEITVWQEDGDLSPQHFNQEQMGDFGEPHEGSPKLKSPRSLALDIIAKESESQLVFLKANIRDLCYVLSLCEQRSTSCSRKTFLSSWNKQQLSWDLFDSLEFLIHGIRDELNTRTSAVSCSQIESLLGEKLQLNPVYNPPLQRKRRVARKSDQHSIPDDDHTDDEEDGGSNVLTIRNIRKQTAIYGDVDLVGRSLSMGQENNNLKESNDVGSTVLEKLTIFNCQNATIYALHPSKFVRIVGCAKCKIIVGPCAGILTVEHCSDIELVGISSHLSMEHCYDSKIHVQTLVARPILLGECIGLEFGPFNTFYPRLMKHLEATGRTLNVITYHWMNPINATSNSISGSTWSVQAPKDFEIFVTPFVENGKNSMCKENPIRLPPDYARALQSKISSVESILRDISNASPASKPVGGEKEMENEEQRKKELERAIQGAFREWLVKTGNIREVVDLIKASTNNVTSSPIQIRTTK